MQYRTLFTLEADLDGVCVDACYTVDMHQLAASLAKSKLTGEADMYAVEVETAFRGIELRSRFVSHGGPYNLHTDDPLDRDTLETLLREKQRNGTLREFLNQART